ncbi:Sensor histidine kinase CitA [Marinomonas aquimarina]|uniref:Sensor histidine kinase CitA n=1 Tax=Marinomonas aquimarina TaxID=295068 RepID=A0A1A8TIL6_9GAMM|nr:sensor histidine kinase [Marinomonas aquimarina]SBS33201.1 Sensor histidine kinase CitA [Marinomonas aquimarina]
MTANTMTLKSYLTVIILSTITLIIAVSGGLLVFVTKQTYLDGVSQRGIELARVIANDMKVVEATARANQGQLQSLRPYIESIRSKTDASYIVITNKAGIRLSHPQPERVGERFIGEDIHPTLEQGVTRTTVATGSLGSAIRNFAPIQVNGDTFGAVSIGYLNQSITDLLFTYYLEAIIWLGFIYISAIILTLSLLSKLKRTFLQYEPEEIVQRFQEHSLLLGSIREGIIAIDRQHKITAINDAASFWLAPEQSHDKLIGLPLEELSQGLSLLIVDSLSKRNKHSITLGRHDFAASLYPLSDESSESGYLIVLNHEQDMSELEQELTRTTAYAHQLRAKTHEHNNKLNVISGLLQAGKTQAAIDYLQQESDLHQNMLGALVKSIENSPVAGMLLAKYNYATEHQIAFTLDEDSQLKHYRQSVNDDLITLIGNLIENAFYAAKQNPHAAPCTDFFISDRTSYLMITVTDSGQGVDEKIAQRIYDLGVSSKADQTQHGVGLYLVSRIVQRYNGSLDWERTDDDTTVFSVYLDKRELEP